MPFDTRTREEKNISEVQLRIERGMSILMESFIPVDRYTQIIGNDERIILPGDGYLFVEKNLGWIHRFVFDDKGNRIRKSSQNTRYVDAIQYETI